MSSKMVSIILPSYNHVYYLKARLDSIFKQSWQDFEVIILDDASTDGSQELLAHYKDHHKVSYLLINETNTGSPFKQWEKGLKLATGNYVWIAESDDLCDPDFLESQLQHLGKAEAIVAKTMNMDEKGTISDEHFHPMFTKGQNVVLNTLDFISCPVSNISAMVFKNPFKETSVNMMFAQYSILGDVFFYFEYFNAKTIVYNGHCCSYVRRQSSSVSDLSTKSLGYYSKYFIEHMAFLRHLKTKDVASYNQLYKPYVKKYFNKIRNRVPRDKKWSLTYFMMFFKFKYFLNFGIR